MDDIAVIGGSGGKAGDDPLRGALAGSAAIVVLGMHRSGTSALAGVLWHLGVALGTRLMAASPDNPRGYWEHVDIVAVHDRLLASCASGWADIRPLPPRLAASGAATAARRELAAILAREFRGIPLWGVKDPRLCRLVPLWRRLFDEAGVTPGYVMALRHPVDVAASLQARDGLGSERALLLWLRHVLEAERQTRGQRRTVVHYESLVTEGGWRPAAAQIARDLGIAWPAAGPLEEAAIDAFLSSELRHRRASETRDHGGGDGRARGWVEAVYAALAGADDVAAVCDAVGRELAHADRVFMAVLGDAEARHARNAAAAMRAVEALKERLARSEHKTAELRAAALRQDAELAQLKRRVAAGSAAAASGGEDGYRYWLASRGSAATSRRDWLEERARTWPFQPNLALGMIVPAGTEDRLLPTLRSLQQQIVGDWELHIAAEGGCPAALAGEQRLWWHAAAGSGAATLSRVLAEAGAAWVGLIDAGDQLAPHALFAVADALFRRPAWGAVYSDEDRIDPQGTRSAPHFKPDFNLELLRSMPYVGGLMAVRREVFAAVGGFDPGRDGIEEYDLALRLAERLGPAGFGHIADVLYHRLTFSGRSTRPGAEICADMPLVVQAHLDRLGVAAVAEAGAQPFFCRVHYRHAEPQPLVSIIVPTRDQLPLLKRCVEIVLKVTEYANYEIIIVDNGSADLEACQYLAAIDQKSPEIGSRIRVLRHPGPFNFSAMNNRAVREAARGDYICLLNNDAAPLEPGWLDELMAYAQRDDVGVVGGKLHYADGRIQHAGVILGIGWGMPAEHPYIGDPGDALGYWGRALVAQELSAVTAACLVVRRSVYDAVGGLDEEDFAVSYNDVDFCLRVAEAGYRVLWTPYARLLHDGGASQRADVERTAAEAKAARIARERAAMYRRWLPRIAFDPAYNRNLSACGRGFEVEREGPPSWDPEFRPRPRVIAYPADREGCGEYRIIAPSRVLFQSGRVHACEMPRLATPPEIARIAPDSIVLQRQLEPHQIDFIRQLKELSGACRIFEIDDLITNLPLRSVHRKGIAADIGERLRQALALCDRLVVSTEPLARAYGRLCAETVVLPNRLERARWAGLQPTRRPGKPRVGWAGAIGHTGDLALMAGVVEATAKQVDWVFFGMCPDNLRRFVTEVHGWVPLPDYAETLAGLDLDLAIAPLEHNPFNEAKSNLRLLEYGVLGYPVVCTDIIPYQGGLPVVRVANRARAWIAAIRDLVADRDACRRAGEALRAAVLADWMLDDHLADWVRAWLP